MQEVLRPSPSFLLPIAELAKIIIIFIFCYQMEIMMLTYMSQLRARDHVHEQLLKRPQVHQDSGNYKRNGHFCIRGNAQHSALLV